MASTATMASKRVPRITGVKAEEKRMYANVCVSAVVSAGPLYETAALKAGLREHICHSFYSHYLPVEK